MKRRNEETDWRAHPFSDATSPFYLPQEVWSIVVRDFLGVGHFLKLSSLSKTTHCFFREILHPLKTYFSERLGAFVDILPTFCHCAEADSAKIDETSGFPYQEEEEEEPARPKLIRSLLLPCEYQTRHANDYPQRNRWILLPRVRWSGGKPTVPFYRLQRAHSTCGRWLTYMNAPMKHEPCTFVWDHDSRLLNNLRYSRSQTKEDISANLLPPFRTPAEYGTTHVRTFSESPMVGCARCILVDVFSYTLEDFKDIMVTAEKKETAYWESTGRKRRLNPNHWRTQFGRFYSRKTFWNAPYRARRFLTMEFASAAKAIPARTPRVRREKLVGEYESLRKNLVRDFFLRDLYLWLLLNERFRRTPFVVEREEDERGWLSPLTTYDVVRTKTVADDGGRSVDPRYLPFPQRDANPL